MQNEAKEKLKQLIDRYEKLTDKEIKEVYNEQRTKDHFIRPLFEALGWDFLSDVWSETDVLGKRVDYAFMISGNTKFLVEAKPLKADLDMKIHAKQAIKYAWNKGITWAILTDFESIKIFNAQAHSKLLLDKLVFEISYKDYLSDFKRLNLLSKESFKNNALDDYAIKHGKKLKKLTVNDKLFNDLKEIRKGLTDGFGKWDKTINSEDLEEGVQRIIERLMFIRVLEDKGLEDPVLMPILHKWENNQNEPLFKKLITKFRELDDIYNSNIFKKHACEDWEEYGVKWNKIFSLLYGSQVYEYDFKRIPADVLGGVYESYLSYIAQNPIEIETDKESGKLFKTEDKREQKEKSREKRKEQGIFYTPRFIVDYIVENTVGKKLGEAKSMHELKQIKILDPACGSGSFLTKALKVFNEKYIDFGNPGGQATKSEILLSNIYGVDLDPKAVELAKLNLLVEALEEQQKLPDLTENVRVGNSLISGEEKELEKYFGKDWRDKRPFNWEEEFKGVFKQGGFDVIIGNPPWVSIKGKQKSLEYSDKELLYYYEKLDLNTYAPNLYEAFIRKSLSLLKDGGLFSFIVPDRFCANSQFIKLREYLLSHFSIKKLLFRVDFPGVIADTVIFVIEKNKFKNNIIEVGDYSKQKYTKILQSVYNKQPDFSFFFVDNVIFEIFNKILLNSKTKPLSELVKSTSGCGAKSNLLNKEKQNEKEIKVIKGENIGRYNNKGFFWFDFKNENLSGRTRDVSKLGFKNKILLRKTGIDLIATFDDSSIYPEQSLYFIYDKDKDLLLYLLAIINSKLLNNYYQNFAITNRDATPQLKNIDLDKFPIIIPKKDEKIILCELGRKMIQLNSNLLSLSENSDKWRKIKEEIEKTDKEIDQKVYELYGLTKEEIKIIEKN